MENNNSLYQYSFSYVKRLKINLIVIFLLSLISYIIYLSKDYYLYNYAAPMFVFLVASSFYKGEWGVAISSIGIKINYFNGNVANIRWEEVDRYQIFKPRITWEMTYVILKKKNYETKIFPIAVKDSESIIKIFDSKGIKKNIDFNKTTEDSDLSLM